MAPRIRIKTTVTPEVSLGTQPRIYVPADASLDVINKAKGQSYARGIRRGLGNVQAQPVTVPLQAKNRISKLRATEDTKRFVSGRRALPPLEQIKREQAADIEGTIQGIRVGARQKKARESGLTPEQKGQQRADAIIARNAALDENTADELRGKFKVNEPSNLPFGDKYKQWVSGMIDQGYSEKEINSVINTSIALPVVGGIAGAGLIGGAISKSNTAKTENYAQERANALIERREQLIAQRNMEEEMPQEPRRLQGAPPPKRNAGQIPYTFSDGSETAQFGWRLRNPFVKEQEGLGRLLTPAVALPVAVAGYGALSLASKRKAEDALKINQLKDKKEKAMAKAYYNSGQYDIDNLLGAAKESFKNPLLDSIPTHNPLDELGNKKSSIMKTGVRPAKKRQADYSKFVSQKTADFIFPLIPFVTPILGMGGAAYSVYRRKKREDQQDQVIEAQRIAELDKIGDPELKATLIAKARGQVIDDESRNQIVDSVMKGDLTGALSTGLKRVQLD